MQTKPILKSKTLWVNGIIFAASFIPQVAEWVKAHPTEILSLLGAANIILRLATKGKVSLWGDEA